MKSSTLHKHPTLKSSVPLTNFVATTNDLSDVLVGSPVLMVNELFSGNTWTGNENFLRIKPDEATFNRYLNWIHVKQTKQETETAAFLAEVIEDDGRLAAVSVKPFEVDTGDPRNTLAFFKSSTWLATASRASQPNNVRLNLTTLSFTSKFKRFSETIMIFDTFSRKLRCKLQHIGRFVVSFEDISTLTTFNYISANYNAVFLEVTIFTTIINGLLYSPFTRLIVRTLDDTFTCSDIKTRFKLQEPLQMTSTLFTNLNTETQICT